MQIYDDSPNPDPRLLCRGCGRLHTGARLVTLPDGREVGNYSEALRQYHEAVWVLRKKRSRRTRIEYLDAVGEKRGQKARDALREEMMRIWEFRQK